MSKLPKAAITGWPVTHSRSPLVQEYWLKKYGLEGSYGRRAVDPAEAEAFYRNFAASGLVGANVTIPHKETAAAACDHLDDAAQAMGAARAIVWSLLSRGFEAVHIFNRTVDKAKKIAESFGSRTIAHAWEDLGDYMGKADLLVNTTSLGMAGKPPLEIDLTDLPKSAIVTDAIYVPLKTDLLKNAEARGNRTVDGLGMLLHQAVPGFERWFGVRPEVDDALRTLILDDLEKTG